MSQGINIAYSILLQHDNIAPPCAIILINSSPPGQNGHDYADDIFKCIFWNEKFCILIWISLKFVTKGPIDNKWASV